MRLIILEDFETELSEIVEIVGRALNDDFFDEDDLMNMISAQKGYEKVRHFLKKSDRSDLLSYIAELKNSKSSKFINYLTELASSFGYSLEKFISKATNMFVIDPDCEYALSSFMTKTIPNKNNFYIRSVGFWRVVDEPNREPDYISYSNYSWNISSQYWYTTSGVYRKSDHWGLGIASCDWYLENRASDGMIYDSETAFIAWKDLKAKGEIYINNGVVQKINGFDFCN